jgi:hypothetical protein
MTVVKSTKAITALIFLGCINLLAQNDASADRSLKANVRQIVAVFPRVIKSGAEIGKNCDALAKKRPSILTMQERQAVTRCPEIEARISQLTVGYETWLDLYSKFKTCHKLTLGQDPPQCVNVRRGLEDQTATLLKLARLPSATPETEFDPGRWFKNGLVPVRIAGKYGFVHKRGQVVIQPTFEFADTFSDGFAPVLSGEYPNKKWGFVDTSGKFVIPPTIGYETIVEIPGPFSGGLARFYYGGKIGFLNRAGEVVIPALFEHACEFSDGRSGVLGPHGEHMFIDVAGRTVIGPLSSGIGCFSEGLAPVTSRPGYEFLDTSGRVAIMTPPGVVFATEFSEGLAPVATKSSWGYINKKGQLVIACQFDYAGPFKEGLARVEIKQSWGYIDKSGKVVIPIQFTDAEDFSEGVGRVRSDNKYMFINSSGKTVLTSVREAEDWPNLP